MITAQFSDGEKIIRQSEQIKSGNDQFRTTMIMSPTHRFVMSESVADLAQDRPEMFADLLSKVRGFSDFTEDNDPHGEHDFGKIVHGRNTYFWKIDYYDSLFEYGADPYTAKNFCRVLTIMRSDEY